MICREQDQQPSILLHAFHRLDSAATRPHSSNLPPPGTIRDKVLLEEKRREVQAILAQAAAEKEAGKAGAG